MAKIGIHQHCEAPASRPSHESARSGRARKRRVPQVVFALLWFLIISFHCLNGAIAFVSGTLHLIMSKPSVYESIAAAQIPIDSLTLSGWSYLIVAALHVISIAVMIIRSIRRRTWTFGWPEPPVPEDKSSADVVGSVDGSPLSMLARRTINTIRAFVFAFFRADGFFGVNGKYFFAYYGWRELIEVLSQSYQAYFISRTVEQPAMNHLAVAMVMVNALSSPILMIVFRKQDGLRRSLTVVIDLCLDFVCAIIIPLVLIYPVLQPYDWEKWEYPDEKVYDYIWLTRSIAVVRQIFVTSTLDFMATLLPHTGLVFGLNTVKKLLDRRGLTRVRKRKRNQVATVSPVVRASRGAAITSGRLRAINTLTAASAAKIRQRLRARVEAAFMAVMVCIGTGVLITHFIATQRVVDPLSLRHCIFPVRPWLVKKTPCSIVHVSCHVDKIEGHADQVTSILETMDRDLVTTILITHCPELVVPPILTEFSKLRGLVLFNNTIVDWPKDAAISRQHHPCLYSLDLLDVNMSTFPVGISESAMPPSLLYFALQHSNLTMLPSTLGAAWDSHEWKEISLRFNRLRELSPHLGKIQTERWYIAERHVETIPEELFLAGAVPSHRVILSSPQVDTIPLALGRDQTTSLQYLMVENTNVSSVDENLQMWLEDGLSGRRETNASFYGSPVCQDPIFSTKFAVYCSTYHESDQDDTKYRLKTQPLRLQ